ncbi:hypothetical protein BD310DRAFT_1009989, partial [Dichomitus squalens]
PRRTRCIDVGGFGTLRIHHVHQPSQLDRATPLLMVYHQQKCKSVLQDCMWRLKRRLRRETARAPDLGAKEACPHNTHNTVQDLRRDCMPARYTLGFP